LTKASSQILEAQQALTDNLPPQLQPLVNRYDEAEQDGIAMMTMYRQGFMDGVKSTKLIRRYGTIHKFFRKWLPQ
jgi:hypothetical protein